MKKQHIILLELLESSGPALHALLTRLTLGEHIAEELMQELFIKLSDNDKLTAIENPAAYARRTAINLAFDWRRRNKPAVNIDAIAEPHSTIPSPLDKLIHDEHLNCVMNSIEELSPEARQVLVMRSIEQASYGDIAEHTPPGKNKTCRYCKIATRRYWRKGDALMNDYYEKIVNDKLHRLSEITPSAASTQRAMDAAREGILNSQDSKTSGFFGNPITRLAIAAAIIIAVCLGIMLVNSNSQSTPNKQIVKPNNTDSTIAVANGNGKKQAELKELETLYVTGNVDGLIAKLSEGNLEIAVVAAGYLGKTGDDRAIAALEKLAEKWDGETENPFEKAIEEIQSGINSDEDTTEEIQQTEEPEISPAEPNSLDAANGKKEYEKPKNLHLTEEQVKIDGTYIKSEMWIRLPDDFKQVSDETTVIDNGIERLTLNHKEKTAQFEDSWNSVKPPAEHHYFGFPEYFRNGLPDNIKSEKNTLESTDEITAYDLTITNKSQTGKTTIQNAKGWVYTDSLLVSKIKGKNPDNDPNIGDFQRNTISIEYSPITDGVFEMAIPVGYNILGHKGSPTFSGRVIDEEGNPVAGAKVYMKARGTVAIANNGLMETFTDSDGFFIFSMHPEMEGLWDHYPICLWAFLEDDVEHIAWTLIRSDKARKDETGNRAFGGPIPQHHGEIVICERYEKGGPWCKGASGIVLQMEESGSVFGRVKDSLGNPIANAQISVDFNIPNKSDHIRIYGHDLWATTGKTDDQGYYIVNRLPKLWNKVRWNIATSADRYNGKAIQEISTGALDEILADFELLLPGITVRGTLVDNYGKVLDERRVSVSAGDGNSERIEKTDANGRFVIKDCPITDKLKVTAVLSQKSYAPHLREKSESYVFYPNVSKDILMADDTFEYEVDLVAELPELTFEIEVVDSSGLALPYFPVELRSKKIDISSEWRRAKLLKRTGTDGLCVIEDVPNIEGLMIVQRGYETTRFDRELNVETKKLVASLRERYVRLRADSIAVELVEGQLEYKIRVTLLTQDEYMESMKSIWKAGRSEK